MNPATTSDTDTLSRLAAVIESRKPAHGGDPASSYVARLFDKGTDAILKKIGEEATETVMAGKDGDRQKLWAKGEESGHVQQVHEIRLDCDNDVLLLQVTQLGHEPGIACHTGRHRCFFQRLEDGAWKTDEPVLKDPHTIYAP